MKKAAHSEQEEGEQAERLSKTQKKNAALELQELGERLVKLPDQLLDQMDLPEKVLAAVQAAKTITKHNPLNRQIQHIGSLMRKHDPAPVREFLDALERGTRTRKSKVNTAS